MICTYYRGKGAFHLKKGKASDAIPQLFGASGICALSPFWVCHCLKFFVLLRHVHLDGESEQNVTQARSWHVGILEDVDNVRHGICINH